MKFLSFTLVLSFVTLNLWASLSQSPVPIPVPAIIQAPAASQSQSQTQSQDNTETQPESTAQDKAKPQPQTNRIEPLPVQKLTSKQHFSLAEKLIESKKHKEAVQHLNAVLKKNPNHFKSLWALYRSLEELKSTDDQRLAIEHLYKTSPNDIDVLSEICKTYYHQKFLIKAFDLCKKAIQKDSANPVNHAHLAKSYWDYGKEKIAVNVIKTASKRFPKDLSTQKIAGQIYLENQNKEQAMLHFKKAHNIDEQDSSVNIALAQLHTEKNNFEMALKHLKMSCLTDPYNSRSPLRRATTKLRLANNQEWTDKYNIVLNSCYGKKNTKISL